MMRKHRLLSLFVFFALVSLLATLPVAALAAPRSQMEPDDAAARVAEVKAAEPTYSESFRTDSEGWEEHSDDTWQASRRLGRYRINVTPEQMVVWSTSPTAAADFLAEVDIRHVAGPLDGAAGIVFGFQDSDNYALFSVSGDGLYRLAKKVDGVWEDQIDLTETYAANTGDQAKNRVGLLVEDGQIALLVNDTVVATYEDPAVSAGDMGVVAETFDSGGYTVDFDNLDVWDLSAVEPAPTEEPTAEPTPEPTAEPTEEPRTPEIDAAQIAALREGDPTFSDQFRRDDGNWDLEETDSGTAEIAARALQIDVIQEGMTMWVTLNENFARDFLAEVDVSVADGAPNTQIGLLFRVQDADNFYSYYIDGEGNYALWKLVDNEWEEIIPTTPSDLLDTSDGAVNRLGVLAQGSTIVLLLNDEIVDQTSDDTFAGGQLALSLGTVDEANATGRFDNFDLWVQAEATPEDLGIAPPPAADAEQRLADILVTDPLFTDSFTRDNGNWSLDSDETVAYELKGRKLHITVNKENWLGWTMYNGEAPADLLAAVDGAVPEDSPVGEYGIVFRSVDDSNYYIAALSTDGYFGIWKNVDGEWEAIADWTSSDLIDLSPEAVNRLAVLVEGSQFTLYINDVPATTVEDDTFAAGDMGLFAGSFDDFPFTVAFDDVELWDLSQ